MGKYVPDSFSSWPGPLSGHYEHGSVCPATGQESIQFLGEAESHGVDQFATRVVCARAFHKTVVIWLRM